MKPRPFLARFATLLALMTAFSAFGQHARAAAYIKFDGIDGEASAPEGDGWILIESFSFGIEREGASLKLGDIKGEARLDKSSPQLAEALLTGQVIPKATIHLTRDIAGKEEVVYEIEASNVLLLKQEVRFQPGLVAPADAFSLNYEEIKWTYTPIDPDTGKKGTPVQYSYSVNDGN